MFEKHNNYKYLIKISQVPVALLLALSASHLAVAAEPNGAEAARLDREAAELSERQAEAARGYSDFIHAVKNSPRSTPISANQHLLLPGQSGVYNVIQARREEESKRIHGKVYNTNGEVVGSAKNWIEPPSNDKDNDDADDEDTGKAENAPGPSKKARTSPGTSETQPFVSTTVPGGSRSTGGSRPVQTLDGSNVPKELHFNGTKKP